MSHVSLPARLVRLPSVRLSKATRDRLKAVAAARGETVQGLVGGLVERFLVAEDRRPPALGLVLNRLQAYAPVLRERGVTGLWVFGSVARGEARVDSDIDLFAEFDPQASLSLVSLASMRAELSDLLGTTVDLVERSALRPTVRETAEREAVRVLRRDAAPASGWKTSVLRPKMQSSSAAA